MSTLMIRLAAIYFVIGVGLGIYMAATKNFGLMPVHAHINLLGWVSLALAGLIYKLWPRASKTRLALAHVALYNTGLPLMFVALALFFSGVPQAEPIIGIGGTLVGLGVVSLALNILLNIGTGDSA